MPNPNENTERQVPSINANFRQPPELQLSGNVSENWRKWHQKFQIYMKASGSNKQSQDTQVCILLNLIGDEALEVYNTFKFDAEEDKDNLNIVLDKFKKYCEPRKNLVYERFRFFRTVQKEGQPIDGFITELKKAAALCEFQEQEDSLILLGIVLGIRDQGLQERLLGDQKLTLLKASEHCRAAEDSRRQAREVQKTSADVHAVWRAKGSKDMMKPTSSQQEQAEKFQCRKCGYSHKYRDCFAWGKVCSLCKQKNHFAIGCPSKKKKPKTIQEVKYPTTFKDTENMESSSDESSIQEASDDPNDHNRSSELYLA